MSKNTNMENMQGHQVRGTVKMENCSEYMEGNRTLDSPPLIQPAIQVQCHPMDENHTETSEKQQTRNNPRNQENTGEANLHPESIHCSKNKGTKTNCSTLLFKWSHRTGDRWTTITTTSNTSIIEALKTSITFNNQYAEAAHSLTIFGTTMGAWIHPSVPCGALWQDEKLELKYTRSTKQTFPDTISYPFSVGGLFIKVYSKGRTTGGQCKPILHKVYDQNDISVFAVFGYKNETVKQAFHNDNRFKMPDIFKLEGKDTIESNSVLYKQQDDIYSVISLVRGKDNPNIHPKSEVAEPNFSESCNADQQLNVECNVAGPSNPTNNKINESASLPTEAMRKTVETFKKEFKEYVRNCGNLSNAWRLMKENYSNNMKERPLSTHTLKLLAQHADSVGCIVTMQKDNIIHLGTGFLLTGCLGLTCHHVVKNFLDPDCHYTLWIIFKYQEKGHSIQKLQCEFSCPIKINFFDENYDFAFFNINPSDNPICSGGLLKHVVLPPLNGCVSIIGHPDGQYQQIDPECSVIHFHNRQKSIEKTVADNPEFINIQLRYSFMEMADPRRLTYNTRFFHGSSGSPVFNDSGELVAMHQGGYAVKTPRKTESPIEYGRMIVDIIICGAVTINDLFVQFRDVVKKDASLNSYIHLGQHPPRMQDNIRHFLKTTFNDPSNDDVEMDSS